MLGLELITVCPQSLNTRSATNLQVGATMPALVSTLCMDKLCSTEFYLKETHREKKSHSGKEEVSQKSRPSKMLALTERKALSPLRMQGGLKDIACYTLTLPKRK